MYKTHLQVRVTTGSEI